MEMVTIPKKEYERLKKLELEEEEMDLEEQFKASLEDLKKGRFTIYP